MKKATKETWRTHPRCTIEWQTLVEAMIFRHKESGHSAYPRNASRRIECPKWTKAIMTIQSEPIVVKYSRHCHSLPKASSTSSYPTAIPGRIHSRHWQDTFKQVYVLYPKYITAVRYRTCTSPMLVCYLLGGGGCWTSLAQGIHRPAVVCAYLLIFISIV